VASVIRPEMTAREEARTVIRGMVVDVDGAGDCKGDPVACGAIVSRSVPFG